MYPNTVLVNILGYTRRPRLGDVEPGVGVISDKPLGLTLLTMTDFILGGSKITADGDGNHEIKGHLLRGRKVMTNLDSILKASAFYFDNKGLSSQSYGFSSSHVWM